MLALDSDPALEPLDRIRGLIILEFGYGPTFNLRHMGHQFGLRVKAPSVQGLHQMLVSLPTFLGRSSTYGYLADGFEAKNANAYLFVAQENRVGEGPHPDMEVVIEPYGLYINSFSYVAEVALALTKHFGESELIS